MCLPSGGDGGAGAANIREAQRRDHIKAGREAIDFAFNQFDDAFYQKTRDAYREYTQPQFDRQAQNAQEQLEFALARGGLGNSSAGARQRGDLAFDIGTQRQVIADQGEDVVRRQKQGVEDTRQSLVTQLQADADAGAATNAAAARYAMANQLPVFSPVGELFRNVGKTLSVASQGEGILPAYSGAGGSARLFSVR